jgi:hypothetical protein
MLSKFIYSFILSIYFFPNIYSQNDTILKTYNYPNSTLSLNSELLTLTDGRLLFTNFGAGLGCSMFVTDNKGEIVHERILDTIAGFEIKSSSFIFNDEDRYVPFIHIRHFFK